MGASSLEEPELPVRVTRARRISSPLTIRLTGELRPITENTVISGAAGEVTELRVKPGDFVAAGSVIAIVRPAGLDQRLAAVQASISAAEQELRVRKSERAQAEQRLARQRENFRRDLIARRDVEEAEIMMETARAQAELAAAYLAQQQAMLSQVRGLENSIRVTAPLSGEVVNVRVRQGASVGAGGAILTLADLDTLRLTAGVSGVVAFGLRPEIKARIADPTRPDTFVEGKIVRVEPDSVRPSEIVEVEIQLINRQRYFRPGMMVEAAVDVALPDSFVWISRSAVNEGSYVFKIANGRAVRQSVVLGPERGGEIAIAGVQEGDSIITEAGMANVRAGSRVRSVNASTGQQ